jgi:hypothetical protein
MVRQTADPRQLRSIGGAFRFVEQARSQPGDFQASPDDGADIDGTSDQGPHLCLPRRSPESAVLEIDWTKKLQHFI